MRKMFTRRRLIFGAAFLATFGLGVSIGSGAEDGAPATAEPVVKEVKVEVPGETITETVEVEVVPQSCLDALDDADDVMLLAAEGFDASSRGFYAAAEFDIASLEAATADLNGLAPQMRQSVDAYRATANQCRSAGR